MTAAERSAYWIGAEGVPGPGGTVSRGPMYVERHAPEEPGDGPPIVLIHGGGGQGTDYLETPDGRPGWAPLLVDAGHTVHVVDRPGHGRSPYHPDVLGPMGPPATYEFCLDLFVPAPDSHPTAHLHTQWPGKREARDPVMDRFVAGTGPTMASFAAQHELERRRFAELLDRVGPAVVVCHSAGGPAGFLAADARPDLVRALVAIEVLGPPFLDRPERGGRLDYGMAAAPLELENLARTPIAVVTAEASRWTQFDAEVVAFLERGDCDVELVRLADHGVHGNGHGMMLERNNAEVLAVVVDWIQRTLSMRGTPG